MDIVALKEKLGVKHLELAYLTDAEGNRQIDPTTNAETKWLKHWDNDRRQAILIHEDTALMIKKDPANVTNLGTKPAVTKSGAGGEYIMHVVINYTAPAIVI